MIQPLKDMDGNYIPLDTTRLYDDDGYLVKVIGYTYILPDGPWLLTDSYGELFFPSDLHLHKSSTDNELDEYLRRMGDAFNKLNEHCK